VGVAPVMGRWETLRELLGQLACYRLQSILLIIVFLINVAYDTLSPLFQKFKIDDAIGFNNFHENRPAL
jgi:hypothetical protein